MAVISGKRLEAYTYQFRTDSHEVIADVNAKLGGNDRGPNPHEYLEVALAACTSITLQMYAAKKNMALESVDVGVKITAEGASNEIKRTVRLEGDLSESDRTNLLAIAEKCPIHKFLSAGAKIITSLE